MASTADRLKLILVAIFAIAQYTKADSKVICYYDSRSHSRTGQGKFDLPFIEPALAFCSHLIYGYADINPQTYKAIPLDEKFDVTSDNYRHVTELKRRFPGLRVLLSIGGEDLTGQDKDKIEAYTTMLESVDTRLTFINSAKELVKFYGFDGLDLAMKLPKSKPKKIHSSFKQFFINIKHSVVGESIVDEKAAEHKEQFTALVREIKNNFRHDGLLLSLSILPNVNSTVYCDPRQLAPHIDFVSLNVFDFYTPHRNPKEADYTAPLYNLHDRKFDENGDFQVRYWLQNGCPNNKIIFGIPTYGRTWKMDDDSGLTGVPPLSADGAGEAGPYTQQEGLMSYPEICSKIATPTEIQAGYLGKLRKINDPSKRFGGGKFRIQDLEPALPYCTHLIYGYAAIKDETFKLVPLNEQFDVIKNNYGHVMELKKKFPNLKVLLSVGGNEDVAGEDEEINKKYRDLLESSAHRLAFVNSAYTLVKGYGFDGLDLAWEFPPTLPKKIKTGFKKFWSNVKSTFTGEKVLDENAHDHREQFTALVRELKGAFRPDNLLLSLTVLPNTNSTVYYDPRALSPYLDFVVLHAFDFYTPQRNKKLADFPSPLYELPERRSDDNIDAWVKYWTNNGAPANKIVLGIPTYSRTWKLEEESKVDELPISENVDGPGDAGPLTKESGLLSYPEICNKLEDPAQVRGKLTPGKFKKVTDVTKKRGDYAYRLPDENEEGGVWIAYEGPDAAANKAAYAKSKGLGGIAVDDLTLDDFQGTCTRNKYSILRAAVTAF